MSLIKKTLFVASQVWISAKCDLFSLDIKLLHALNRCEPDPIFANPDPSLPSTEFKTIALLSDLCEKELVATIGWAKQIPGSSKRINDVIKLQ